MLAAEHRDLVRRGVLAGLVHAERPPNSYMIQHDDLNARGEEPFGDDARAVALAGPALPQRGDDLCGQLGSGERETAGEVDGFHSVPRLFCGDDTRHRLDRLLHDLPAHSSG